MDSSDHFVDILYVYSSVYNRIAFLLQLFLVHNMSSLSISSSASTFSNHVHLSLDIILVYSFES